MEDEEYNKIYQELNLKIKKSYEESYNKIWGNTSICENQSIIADEPTTLNYDDCLKVIDILQNLSPMPKIYYSSYCGNLKNIKRTWKERLFTLPWNPWIKTKIYIEPTIYKIGDNFVAHISYKSKIERILHDC
jgi:hypothetical protein